MKNKILFIFISLFLLMIGVNNISAYVIYEDDEYIIDEQFIYDKLSTYENFSIDNNDIFVCSNGSSVVSCYIYSSLTDLTDLSGSYNISSDRITYYYNVANHSTLFFRFFKINLNSFTRGSYDLQTYNNQVTLSIFKTSYTNFELPLNPDNVSDFTHINTLDFSQFQNNEEPEEPEPEEYQIENKIYLPIELDENMCPYILDKDTIRVYDETPTQNSTVTYTDYFVNSHYISKSGSETFENDVLMCLDKSKFTTAFYYRFDFDKIIIIFISMLTIVYVIFGKIIHSFFIGFRR